jgi:hypothetical protein
MFTNIMVFVFVWIFLMLEVASPLGRVCQGEIWGGGNGLDVLF